MSPRFAKDARITGGSDGLRGSVPCQGQGKTKRNNSPPSARAAGSETGNLPFQRFQDWGTRRVCAAGRSTHPWTVSSRRNTENTESGRGPPLAAFHSSFNSNRLAARLSVKDSQASRLRIHPGAANREYSAGAHRAAAATTCAPYSRATCTVPSLDPWSTIRM